MIAAIDTKSNGLFVQQTIGQHGNLFKIVKFKTFHPITRKVNKIGRFLRISKLDELP